MGEILHQLVRYSISLYIYITYILKQDASGLAELTMIAGMMLQRWRPQHTEKIYKLPLLSILKVLSHSSICFWVGCHASTCAPSNNIKQHIIKLSLAISMFFFFLWIDVHLQKLSPSSQESWEVHARTWHSQRMLAWNCGSGQAAFGLQS